MSERRTYCQRCGTMPTHICIDLPSTEGTPERSGTGLENQGGISQGFDSSTLRQYEDRRLTAGAHPGPSPSCRLVAVSSRACEYAVKSCVTYHYPACVDCTCPQKSHLGGVCLIVGCKNEGNCPSLCVKCSKPVKGNYPFNSTYYGAGDGRGQKFQCQSCWNSQLTGLFDSSYPRKESELESNAAGTRVREQSPVGPSPTPSAIPGCPCGSTSCDCQPGRTQYPGYAGRDEGPGGSDFDF